MRLPFFVFRAGRAVTGRAHTRTLALMGRLSVWLGRVGCDPQRIAELKKGVATEADVRTASVDAEVTGPSGPNR